MLEPDLPVHGLKIKDMQQAISRFMKALTIYTYIIFILGYFGSSQLSVNRHLPVKRNRMELEIII